MNLPVSRADEIFVREFVTTADAVTACMRAGIRLPGVTMRESALMTLQRADIQAMIREAKMTAKYSQPLELTQRSIAEDLERIYDQAVEKQAGKDWRPDLKAAIMAKEAQAKILGLLVNKVEISKAKDVTEASTEELERWLLNHKKMIEGESARVIDAEEVGPEGVRVEPEEEDQKAAPSD